MTVRGNPSDASVVWMLSSPTLSIRMSVAALSLIVSIMMARSRTETSASSAKTDNPVGPSVRRSGQIRTG